jgi:Xaa-Pro aminopeptidase
MPSTNQQRSERAFAAQEFAARRGRIMDAMGEGAHALLQGAPPPRGYVRFRQTNEFYYCAGLEAPQAYLLIDGTARASALYLPWRGQADLAEGAWPGAEDAELVREITGIERVFSLDLLADHLAQVKTLYTPHAPAEAQATTRPDLEAADRARALDPWDGQPAREQRLIALLRTRNPRLTIRDLTPILDALRALKSPREVAVMRRTGALAAEAVIQAMRVTRPGLIEGQLGALASYIYAVNGAQGEGYRPIIAGGENIWHIHYFRCDAPLRAGDLVLMDYAPECDYYTNDIGRVWPVSGRWNAQQRELYGFVLAYHKTLLDAIRPGALPERILEEAAATMRGVWEGWPWSKEVYRRGAEGMLAFDGHLSHPVGMAVHDDGSYRGRPLEPGTVFAIDPQLWVPEERIYLRVEDTVVVTEQGRDVLTGAAPLEMDEIETLMQQGPLPLPHLLDDTQQ